MTATGFSAAYKRVRVYEGGNVDDPMDPGGRTSHGVTQRVYDAWRANQGQAKRDVFKSTEAERAAIYRRQYWDAVSGDKLPAGIDLVVFDGAVNSGPKQSIKWLQAALGLTADGVLGQVTLSALDDNNDHDALIASIGERRMAFLHHLSTFARFGKGWSARVANVTKAGQAMASGATASGGTSPAPVSLAEVGGNVHAGIADVKTAPVSAGTGNGVAAVGGTLETANEVVSGAASQVQAVSDVSDVLRWLFIALTLLGLAITAYALWRRYRTDRAVSGAVSRQIEWDADEAVA
jgi:lysozyme family protein